MINGCLLEKVSVITKRERESEREEENTYFLFEKKQYDWLLLSKNVNELDWNKEDRERVRERKREREKERVREEERVRGNEREVMYSKATQRVFNVISR